MTAGQANRYSVKGDEEMNEINLNFRQIEEENPYLLIAYIYHLYMGLFSGGQVLTAKVFSRFICKYWFLDLNDFFNTYLQCCEYGPP